MSSNKTLTLHTTKEGNGEHWFTRGNEYAKKEIDSIKDPEGGRTKEPPTSIPSPFARFDLVRTAFAKIAQNENLKGELNDERLVSDCFDVGQVFFNYDKLKDKVKIIKWDKKQGIDSLKLSPFKGHNHLGKALDLFLKQDGGIAKATEDDRRSGGYNFDLMDAIYILKYEDNKDSGIIGGTSPSTLFFSAANDLSFVNIQFGNDKLFDTDFCPLHKREVEYQKFWHGLSRQTSFMKYFPEVSSYLQRSLELLKKENNALWKEIGENAEKLTKEIYNGLFEDLTSETGYLVEILDGFRVKKVKIDPSQLSKSDFIIPSEKYSRLYPDKLKPMVLQDNYQGKLLYTKDYWNKNQRVPSYVAEDWKEKDKRRLPGQQDFYPWLTVSDFLEPYIIRLVYPINHNCFYDGGLSSGNELTKSYLLPLKKDFFDFFDVEDLINGQKCKISMEPLGGESGVKVTLSMPTAKIGEPPIKFERIYKASVSDVPLVPDQNKSNGGSIVELQFGVNLMPFIRIENAGFNPIYKVQVVDRDIDYLNFSNDYNLKFMDRDNKLIDTKPARERSKKKQNAGAVTATTKYYNVGKNFDYIEVEVAGKKGLIAPRFDKVSKQMGSEEFTFAIDFGTTNTHIEYKTNRNPMAMPFEITLADHTLATLHKPSHIAFKDRSDIIAEIIPIELLPFEINRESMTSFPTRTALIENSPNWFENLYGFMDFNPAFLYEKQNLDENVYHIATNLKWSDYKADDRELIRVKGYIQSLLLMIRNKVLLDGGSLEATKLVWFYPLSMLQYRINSFETLWNDSYKDIVTKNNYPQRIPESTAPFYWFANGAGRQTAITAVSHPAVCVDIGGGTSDVVIFKDNKPVCLTSFRFAANAIFGDAFAREGAANRNGFISRYESKIKQLLEGNGFHDLVRAYDAIRNRQHSEDIIAFFFSLQENKEIQKKTTLNFNDMLAKDDSLKIIFLIFYSAIIYHIAKIMKFKEFKMPRYLAFSGNGSKILHILSNNPAVLAELAKLIFEKVYDEPYHEDDLEVIIDQDSPKEVTCKGGLMRSNDLKFNSPDDGKEDKTIKDIKAVLIGSTNNRFVSTSDTYEKIEEDTLSSVAQEVGNFIEFLFNLNNDVFSFRNEFNINRGDLDKYKKILLKDLSQNVKIGFSSKKAESEPTEPMEETIFFYPLIQGLNNLASEIAKK